MALFCFEKFSALGGQFDFGGFRIVGKMSPLTGLPSPTRFVAIQRSLQRKIALFVSEISPNLNYFIIYRRRRTKEIYFALTSIFTYCTQAHKSLSTFLGPTHLPRSQQTHEMFLCILSALPMKYSMSYFEWCRFLRFQAKMKCSTGSCPCFATPPRPLYEKVPRISSRKI